MSKTEIDAVVAEFYGAFDNRGGKPADVARIRRVMLPAGVIVNVGDEPKVYGVEDFIEPREQLLSDGRLVEFSEWETSERTEIVGSLATRTGEYAKSGLLNGEPYEGRGTKTFQLVRTEDGWRIVAFSWFDRT